MSNVFTVRIQTIADGLAAIPNCPKHTALCRPAPWETCPYCEAAARRDAANLALAGMWAALDADARFNR